jgi:S1-C subfamily serine protease
MKRHRLVFTLLLLLTAAVFQLAAQQTEIDQKPVEEVKTKAGAGDADSEFQLGLRYERGEGVPQDFAEAVKWYRKAAEQNLAAAQFNLGVSYVKGEGVAKNHVKAYMWLLLGAGQGDEDAKGIMAKLENTMTSEQMAEGQRLARNFKPGNVPSAGGNTSKAARTRVDPNNPQLVRTEPDGTEVYDTGVRVLPDGSTIRDIPGTDFVVYRDPRGYPTLIPKSHEPAKPRKVPSAGGDSSSEGRAQSRPKASGSGFFITEDGFLITNEHVAGGGARVRLLTAAGIIPAKVVKVDAANDLALLKVEGKFTALPVATSRPVKLGSIVTTVGFPNIGLQGFAPKFARGEIGSLSGPQDDARYFQISVPVQPGNSGGALVDERANVVGVVSAKLSAEAALSSSGALPENVNYAVKSSFLLGFLESVPEVASKLKEPNTKDMKFADVVDQAKEAAVLVLVY